MVITKDENMPIAQLVGYMLKVIKSDRDIPDHHKKRFNAIKHGDYDCFFDLIGEPQSDFIAQYKSGEIKTDGFSQKGGDADITMLHKIEPSVVKFFHECYNIYGDYIDNDISDLIYRKCAAFEIAMRGQKNKERQNRHLPYDSKTLEKTIDEVCEYNNIPDDEKERLQNGRKFVNMVKLHKRDKPDFSSWKDGVTAFEAAWEVCNKYTLKVCY